ncbi:uncharacterized protein [Macrobrachium rosenbergii]|uniref:uncharacterized protein n=1 Tax=Macrobrachium rosenbergii TaxID=79674 RepID=UPI0034D60B6B
MLKADMFILMLRRFAALHGVPLRIYSDNATTFRAADTFLREIYHQEETQQYLRNTGIRWHFQTPRSPWKGGFFERMIGVVKRTQRRLIRRNIFHPEQVRKLVKGAEAVISNRPLMYLGDERDDGVITPSHLIRGDLLRPLPPVTPHEGMWDTLTTKQLRHRYFCLTAALSGFKDYWRDGYLRVLLERHDSREAAVMPLKEGNIVLIKIEYRKCRDWPLGRVLMVYTDPQGVERSAKVLYEGEEHLCAINHTVPLEMSEEEEDDLIDGVWIVERQRDLLECV